MRKTREAGLLVNGSRRFLTDGILKDRNMALVCDKCGKPATTNIQKLWVKWNYNSAKDEYSSTHEIVEIEPNSDENFHFCDEHTELWMNEIDN